MPTLMPLQLQPQPQFTTTTPTTTFKVFSSTGDTVVDVEIMSTGFIFRLPVAGVSLDAPLVALAGLPPITIEYPAGEPVLLGAPELMLPLPLVVCETGSPEELRVQVSTSTEIVGPSYPDNCCTLSWSTSDAHFELHFTSDPCEGNSGPLILWPRKENLH